MNEVEIGLIDSNFNWEICIVGLALTIFTLVNIASKKVKHSSDILLCVWLVLLNVPLIHMCLVHFNLHIPLLHKYTNPTLNLLHGPLLYLYVRKLTSMRVHLSKLTALHMVPFILTYILFISFSHPQPMTPMPENPEMQMGPVGNNWVFTLFQPLLVHFALINGLSFISYGALTFYLLAKHQTKIEGFFSQKNNQITLSWIYALPTILVLVVVANFINEEVLVTANRINPQTLHMISFVSIITILCFFGVKQKPVFYRQQTASSVPEENQKTPTAATDNQGLPVSEAVMKEVIEKMQTYMLNKKPYLDPEFSVYSLADAIDVPRRILSTVLNRGLCKNFYQYVTEFRVEEMKSLLGKRENQQKNILDLAFECGFKSKSSFNGLFKQHTGTTPSQYRQAMSEAQVKSV
ncbi:AraC family transcriptional regulator [Aliiglaciecola sp. NS0011-25]|uniref:helix-turn-helix domain-containing protein n=1 Tax=Aliiglaciecola sp. NS0011-25 TaxID=3127654 RepID=UPI00310BAC0F